MRPGWKRADYDAVRVALNAALGTADALGDAELRTKIIHAIEDAGYRIVRAQPGEHAIDLGGDHQWTWTCGHAAPPVCGECRRLLTVKANALNAVVLEFHEHYPPGINPYLDKAYADAGEALRS